MADIQTGRTSGGGFAVLQPGVGWVEVDEATYDTAKQSRLGRAVSAFGGALQDSAGFALDALTPLTGRQFDPQTQQMAPTMGQRIAAENDPQQAARQAIDPNIELGGQVGAFAAEALFPSGAIAKAFRGGSAARSAAGRGVQTGVELGEAIVAQGQQRARKASDVVGELGGAPGSISGVPQAARQEAFNKGFGNRVAGLWDRAPDEAFNAKADALGFRLTPGIRQNSDGMRQLEAAFESRPGGSSAFRPLREHNAKNLREKFVTAMGGKGDDLSPGALGAMKSDLSDTFERAAASAGDVPLTPTKANLQQALADIDDPVTRTRAQGIVDNLPEIMDGKELYRRMSKIRADADNMWQGQGGDKAVAEAMDDIADAMDQAFTAQLPPAVQKSLSTARDRWRLMRSIERGKAVTTDGEINPLSMDTALRSLYKNEYRYGKGSANPDVNAALDANQVAYRMRDIVGNSGTATRSSNVLDALGAAPLDKLAAQGYLGTVTPGTVVKAAVGPGAAALIGGSLFGQ